MDTETCRLRVKAFTIPMHMARAMTYESPWLGTFRLWKWVASIEGGQYSVKARYVRDEGPHG